MSEDLTFPIDTVISFAVKIKYIHYFPTLSMEIKHNVVGWFEFPVINLERAMKFYETVFDFKLPRQKMSPLYMACFPGVDKSIRANRSLVYNKDHYKPSELGILLYCL